MASYQGANWYYKGIERFPGMKAEVETNLTVGGRFKEMYHYLQSKALVHRQKDLANLIGATEGNVSRMLKGDPRYTTSSMISRICMASNLPFSEDYLLRGEGTLLKDGTQDEAPKKPQRASNEVETNTSGSRIIQRQPIIPIEAKAGIGKGFLYDRDSSQDPDDIYDEFDSMEVFLEREVSDRYKLFRVKGDSMDDDTKRALCNGDVLLCREVYPEDWKYGLINTKFPNVIIVIEEEGILIKQLIKHSKKSETISLHSLNSTYKDLTIDLKKVRAFYYVERLIDRDLAQW